MPRASCFASGFVPILPETVLYVFQITGATDDDDDDSGRKRNAAGAAATAGDGGGGLPRLFGHELLYEHPEILLSVVRLFFFPAFFVGGGGGEDKTRYTSVILRQLTVQSQMLSYVIHFHTARGYARLCCFSFVFYWHCIVKGDSAMFFFRHERYEYRYEYLGR